MTFYFSFEVFIKLNPIQVNIKGGGGGVGAYNNNQGGTLSHREKLVMSLNVHIATNRVLRNLILLYGDLHVMEGNIGIGYQLTYT